MAGLKYMTTRDREHQFLETGNIDWLLLSSVEDHY